MKAVVLALFLAMYVQPMLAGRWLDNEQGVISRGYEFDWFAAIRRLYLW